VTEDAVFAALADPTRRRILRALSETGPATLGELSAQVPVTRQAVTKHLVVLRDAGLVDAEGRARGRRYAFTPAAFSGAVDWMAEVGGWDERLARLKRQVERR